MTRVSRARHTRPDSLCAQTSTRCQCQSARLAGCWRSVRRGGQPRVVFGFTITDGGIVAIELIADPERLRGLDLAIPGGGD